MKHAITATYALILLSLSGCAERGARIEPENIALSAHYKNGTQDKASRGDMTAWWSGFGSKELDRLVALSLDKNPDILSAYERITQAELNARIAGASLFPSLGFLGSASERANKAQNSSHFDSTQSTTASLSLSYELDLFGRVRANKSTAKSLFLASKYDAQTARLSLISSVIESYFRLLNARYRLVIANKNLDIAKRLLKIVQARYDEGAVSTLDLSAQESALLSQKATLASIKNEEQGIKNALAILVGEAPQNFEVADEEFDALKIPSVNVGIPSDLLKNRPDIATALEQLSGGESSVDSAYYALFPSFNINASSALSSSSLLSLSNPASALSLALNATWNLFDSSRLKNALSVEKSKLKVFFENYRKQLLSALKDVEDALENRRYAKERVELQDEILAQTKRALDLASIRYKEGLIDISALLDYQRYHFSAEEQSAQQRLNHLLSLLSLHKAVGGDFAVDR